MLRSGDPTHEPGERQKLVQPSSDLLVIPVGALVVDEGDGQLPARQRCWQTLSATEAYCEARARFGHPSRLKDVGGVDDGKQIEKSCRKYSTRFVGSKYHSQTKLLKTLERVKGIEPSYSAWKAVYG